MLTLNQIHKTFYANTPDEKRAISDLTQTLNEGDFVTVIGSNGAGKSTLLNLLAGTILPDAGNIHLNDQNLTLLSEEKRAKWIGRVFPKPNGRDSTEYDDRRKHDDLFRTDTKKKLV